MRGAIIGALLHELQAPGGTTVICYHGTPFSGGNKVIAGVMQYRDAMVSYYSPESVETACEVCRSVCFDNGAFSAWKSGKPVSDWAGYYDFIAKWKRHPATTWAVIPDVIDGSESDNDALITEWPHKGFGVPVWHLHESLNRLDQLAHDWPMVALGSSGEFAEIGTPQWWHRMTEAMGALCEGGKPRTKIHGLRMLDPALLEIIPFASADSTNVARNIGYDVRWPGPYTPASIEVRALVLMDRIERAPKASTWHGARQSLFELGAA